jgi:hypothetical protein
MLEAQPRAFVEAITHVKGRLCIKVKGLVAERAVLKISGGGLKYSFEVTVLQKLGVFSFKYQTLFGVGFNCGLSAFWTIFLNNEQRSIVLFATM